jgi:hypothetical protein
MVTEFLSDGSLLKGGFAIGNKLSFKGVKNGKYKFYITGNKKYIYYLTVNDILSYSGGIIKNFDFIKVLKVPYSDKCFFYERDKDYKNYIYMYSLSADGLHFNVYHFK